MRSESFLKTIVVAVGSPTCRCKNAFKSLNRAAALWNVRVQWPRCSTFLFNTYRGYASLVMQGSSEFLLSKEGVGQDDPLFV